VSAYNADMDDRRVSGDMHCFAVPVYGLRGTAVDFGDADHWGCDAEGFVQYGTHHGIIKIS